MTDGWWGAICCAIIVGSFLLGEMLKRRVNERSTRLQLNEPVGTEHPVSSAVEAIRYLRAAVAALDVLLEQERGTDAQLARPWHGLADVERARIDAKRAAAGLLEVLTTAELEELARR